MDQFAFFAFIAAFCFAVAGLAYLGSIHKELKMIRELIAAFMEHKVAPTVAENKLARLVQQANKST